VKLEKVFSYKTQRLFKASTCTLNAQVQLRVIEVFDDKAHVQTSLSGGFFETL
jgi:hypothetical protein